MHRYAGVAMMVVGLLLSLKSKLKGVVVFYGGMTMTVLYTAMAEHPLAMMCLVVVMFLSGWWLAYKWIKAQQSLSECQSAAKEMIKVIQPHDDLKRQIGDGNPLKQNAVRVVVDPLKSQLRTEGAIT